MASVSARYRRMADVYRVFARHWAHVLDFSESALAAMHAHESRGEPIEGSNGFEVGKKYLNLTVSLWRQDLATGLLFKHELYADPLFPTWWLDSVLGSQEATWQPSV
jgi:hypothetical protein